VSTNGGASFTSKQVTAAPSGIALATGGVLDTKGNAYIAWSGTNNTGVPTPYMDYQTAAGFDHPYGDYGVMAVDGAGSVYATWGEGESYTGSGNVYYSKF
jgi:hypothetical protein